MLRSILLILSHLPRFSDFTLANNRENTARLDYCTQPANLAGVPAATVPARISRESGLPIGVQLIADNFQDEKLLSASAWLEAELDCPVMVVQD